MRSTISTICDNFIGLNAAAASWSLGGPMTNCHPTNFHDTFGEFKAMNSNSTQYPLLSAERYVIFTTTKMRNTSNI